MTAATRHSPELAGVLLAQRVVNVTTALRHLVVLRMLALRMRLSRCSALMPRFSLPSFPILRTCSLSRRWL